MKIGCGKLRSSIIVLLNSLVVASVVFSGCSKEVQVQGLMAAAEPVAAVNVAADIQKENNMDTQAAKMEKVVESVEEYEASNFPLIAAIPDRNIYLYGVKPGGVILYVEGTGHYYKWDYLTPRFILPKMYAGDFDADGKEEIAVSLYIGSGTGYAVEDLHVVEISGDEVLSRDPSSKDYFVSNPDYFSDHFFEPEDYIRQLDKQVGLKTYEKKAELMADISIGSKVYTVSLKELQLIEKDIAVDDKAAFGNIVYFDYIDGKLTAEFAFGATSPSFGPPFFIGRLYADVNYSEDRFTLTNLRFEPDKEFLAE